MGESPERVARAMQAAPLRVAWTRYRRVRWGVLFIALLAGIGWAAPLLASRQPLVCRYQGQLYFPAVVDALSNLPLVGGLFVKSMPFRDPAFDAKNELDPALASDPEAFAWWPVVAYGPLEIADEALLVPSWKHWLGTDDRGRDVTARLIHGAAVSVRVGFLSMLLAGLIGSLVGATAGYTGGWVDVLLSRLIEVTICFPAFFLILSIMVWVEPNLNGVILVIGLTQWTAIARFVRAEFLSMRESDYVLAARCSGASSARIVFRHMLPGALAPVMVTLAFGVADAVLIEAGLSWLGLGVPTPAPSWGNMLRSAFEQMRSAPHLVYPPCLAIVFSVVAYHLLGDGLREALDPKSRVVR